MHKSPRIDSPFIFTLISILFLSWSLMLIYTSSHMAVDGERYFCLFDDAMISLRYAWNFSHGNGLVYNIGEFVQGYTNLLMTLYMTLVTLFFGKSDSVIVIQITGVLFMLIIAGLNIKITDHVIERLKIGNRELIRLAVFIGTLFYYPLAYWSIMGMETGLLTLLIQAALLKAIRYQENKNSRNLVFFTIYASLAYMTRNDSILITAVIWSYLIWENISDGVKVDKLFHLALALSGVAITVLGQSLFQYLYYGNVMPNTYILKLTGTPLLDRLINGIRFITPFISSAAPLLCFPIILLFWYKFKKTLLLLYLLTITLISYQIYVGGDAWPYWRMMAPGMPTLLILFITSVCISSNRIYQVLLKRQMLKPRGTPAMTRITQAFSVVVITGSLFLANSAFWKEILLLEEPYYCDQNKSNIDTAIVINTFTKDEATLALLWCGAISYYTDRETFDMLGKCDPYIANLEPEKRQKNGFSSIGNLPGHNKYDLDYSIKSKNPTYVQFFKWGNQDLFEWAEDYYVVFSIGPKTRLFLRKNDPNVLWEKIIVYDQYIKREP